MSVTDCSGKVLSKTPRAGCYHTTPRRQNMVVTARHHWAFPDDDTGRARHLDSQRHDVYAGLLESRGRQHPLPDVRFRFREGPVGWDLRKNPFLCKFMAPEAARAGGSGNMSGTCVRHVEP